MPVFGKSKCSYNSLHWLITPGRYRVIATQEIPNLEKNLFFEKTSFKGRQGTEGICIKILKGEFIRNFGPNSTVGLVRERIFWHKNNIMWQHCCNDKRHSIVYSALRQIVFFHKAARPGLTEFKFIYSISVN
jgi:hypothetical protein